MKQICFAYARHLNKKEEGHPPGAVPVANGSPGAMATTDRSAMGSYFGNVGSTRGRPPIDLKRILRIYLPRVYGDVRHTGL